MIVVFVYAGMVADSDGDGALTRPSDTGVSGTCGGFAVVLATDPARCGAFFAELSSVVRESRDGVLIRLRHPARWLGGPVVGIHLRRDTDGGSTLGPGLWLGPLREEADLHAVCDWLRRGGPQAGPPPPQLRSRTLRQPIAPIMALQTSN
jgi:hypothetical protein